MKKYLFLSFLILLFITCKKGGGEINQNLDIVGTWHASFSSDSIVGSKLNFIVTAKEHPCFANNILILNADGTGKQRYIGLSGCGIGPGIFAGEPGDSSSVKWQRQGNLIHFTFTSNPAIVSLIDATVRVKNNQLQLFYNRTAPRYPTNEIHVETEIDIKE